MVQITVQYCVWVHLIDCWCLQQRMLLLLPLQVRFVSVHQPFDNALSVTDDAVDSTFPGGLSLDRKSFSL